MDGQVHGVAKSRTRLRDFTLPYLTLSIKLRLSWCLSVKESNCQCRRCRFDPWVKKIPWRRKWQSTPLFLPWKFHGERSLVGYSPWNHKRVRHGLVTKQQQCASLESKELGPSWGGVAWIDNKVCNKSMELLGF